MRKESYCHCLVSPTWIFKSRHVGLIIIIRIMIAIVVAVVKIIVTMIIIMMSVISKKCCYNLLLNTSYLVLVTHYLCLIL